MGIIDNLRSVVDTFRTPIVDVAEQPSNGLPRNLVDLGLEDLMGHINLMDEGRALAAQERLASLLGSETKTEDEYAQQISERFPEVDPHDKAQFAANYAALHTSLEMHMEWREQADARDAFFETHPELPRHAHELGLENVIDHMLVDDMDRALAAQDQLKDIFGTDTKSEEDFRQLLGEHYPTILPEDQAHLAANYAALHTSLEMHMEWKEQADARDAFYEAHPELPQTYEAMGLVVPDYPEIGDSAKAYAERDRLSELLSVDLTDSEAVSAAISEQYPDIQASEVAVVAERFSTLDEKVQGHREYVLREAERTSFFEAHPELPRTESELGLGEEFDNYFVDDLDKATQMNGHLNAVFGPEIFTKEDYEKAFEARFPELGPEDRDHLAELYSSSKETLASHTATLTSMVQRDAFFELHPELPTKLSDMGLARFHDALDIVDLDQAKVARAVLEENLGPDLATSEDFDSALKDKYPGMPEYERGILSSEYSGLNEVLGDTNYLEIEEQNAYLEVYPDLAKTMQSSHVRDEIGWIQAADYDQLVLMTSEAESLSGGAANPEAMRTALKEHFQNAHINMPDHLATHIANSYTDAKTALEELNEMSLELNGVTLPADTSSEAIETLLQTRDREQFEADSRFETVERMIVQEENDELISDLAKIQLMAGADALAKLRAHVDTGFDGPSYEYAAFENVIQFETGDAVYLADAIKDVQEAFEADQLSPREVAMYKFAMPEVLQAQGNRVLETLDSLESGLDENGEEVSQQYVESLRVPLLAMTDQLSVKLDARISTDTAGDRIAPGSTLETVLTRVRENFAVQGLENEQEAAALHNELRELLDDDRMERLQAGDETALDSVLENRIDRLQVAEAVQDARGRDADPQVMLNLQTDIAKTVISERRARTDWSNDHAW